MRSLLALALALFSLVLPAALRAEEPGFAAAEMMHATGLDEIFTQFGPSIAAAPSLQGITGDATFLRHWEAAALSIFEPKTLTRRLAEQVEGQFSAEDQAGLRAFFHSDFGIDVTALEREIALLDPEQQEIILAEGAELAAAAEQARLQRYDEIARLVGADISASLVGQSVRAMLLGMSLAGRHGDIEVPWDEIDAQVEAMMPQLLGDVADSQRAMIAYAYRDLSDADLDTYIGFLGTASGQALLCRGDDRHQRHRHRAHDGLRPDFAKRMRSVSI